MPWAANICSWRYNGSWHPYFITAMWASKASVSIPPSIAWAGAGCLYHTLAASPAAVSRTHDALDPVLHWNDVEGFLDGLPDLVQPLAAARADAALDIDHDINARQMVRKLPPVAPRRPLSTAFRSVRQAAFDHVIVGGSTNRLHKER